MKKLVKLPKITISRLIEYCANNRLQILIGFYLVALILATSRFMFQAELFRVHDYVHGARIAEMLRSAQAGHLPVRWSENFGYGYGMPLFQFYAPLPFYVGAFVYWITNNLVLSTKLLFLIPNIMAAIGSYLLGKELFGKKGAVIVAAAYTLAPYRAVNLFVRGAVSEAWGMSIMPLALWAGLVVLRKAASIKKYSLAGLTARNPHCWVLVTSLVTLFLSHNLSTLMFTPISALLLLLIAISMVRLHPARVFLALFPVATAYLLAVGLSSFYLLPAFIEKDYTSISSILSGYFHYSHHFLYIRQFFFENWGYGGSAWGPNDDISFFLGYGQLAAAGFSLVAVGNYLFRTNRSNQFSLPETWRFALRRAKKKIHFHYFVLFGIFCAGSLYLTLLKSKWLWDVLPLIAFIQFPWRWLSIAVLMLSLLAGYGVILLKHKRAMYSVSFILIALSLLNLQFFQPESYLDDSSAFYYSDEELIRKQMSSILPDYIPKDLAVAENINPSQNETTDGSNTTEVLPVNEEGSVLHQESIAATILVNDPHQKLVSVDEINENELVFAVAAYPGWKAEINGNSVPVSQTDQGLLSIDVTSLDFENTQPFTAGIYFGATPVRFWSDTLSLFSLAVVLYLLLPDSLLATNHTKQTKSNHHS